jgi:hypothetical protein
MKDAMNPYRGRTTALTTKHGKGRAISRPLRMVLGLTVQVEAKIDTDLLGTFTGEIERVGTPSEVAIRKARLGMESSGLPLGLANEGSFGPHPAISLFMPTDHEMLVFVDDELGIIVVESCLSAETNYGYHTARSLNDLEPFLRQAKFPSHALIVRPNDGLKKGFVFKGVIDFVTLEDAVKRCAVASADGLAHVGTDMRAHVNPTRQKIIRHTACRLARRLATSCPACGTPGWGRIRSEPGLPCEFCHTATEMIKQEIFGCARCRYTEAKPRSDGRQYAEPGQCPYCNP